MGIAQIKFVTNVVVVYCDHTGLQTFCQTLEARIPAQKVGRTSYHYLLLIILGISGVQWLQSNIADCPLEKR